MGRGKVRECLIGREFDRLKVIDYADDLVQPNGRTRVRWLCQCKCGTILPVRAEALRSGGTKSCGCYNKERIKSTAGKCRKHNPYVLRDNYVIFYTYKNEPFIVDLENFYKVYSHCWYTNHLGYLKAKICGKSVFLHRYILGFSDDNDNVDHISGNVWDNRKNNLREVTQSENTMNSAVRSDTSSGVTGVCPYGDEWEAYIYVKGKQYRLGHYTSFDEAVAARHAAEDKYFGEYSRRKSRGE